MVTKVMVLQRLIPSYRINLFNELSQLDNLDVSFLISKQSRGKARQAKFNKLKSIKYKALESKIFNFLGRDFVFQPNLLKELCNSKPDVIICEAESHFISYMQAIVFKIFFKRDVKLVYWCFIALPGRRYRKFSFKEIIKNLTRYFFHHFLLYSSFSEKALLLKGIAKNKLTVAVNVCDTETFLYARPGKFNIKSEKIIFGFIGSFTKPKNINTLIHAANILRQDNNIHFVLTGDGAEKKNIINSIEKLNINNITVSPYSDNVIEAYDSIDCFVLPGRGGMAISEAMCRGKPVIAYQADGVEYDLIQEENNGWLLEKGDPQSLARTIKSASKLGKTKLSNMGFAGKELIIKDFNTMNMVNKIEQMINKITK